MSKNNKDYDNVFKTLKHSHKRLFIPIINNTFSKNYPLDTPLEVLSSESSFNNPQTQEVQERESDLLLKICGDLYMIECQSYEDGNMAIRIAEYSFLSARDNAIWENGRVYMPMPYYTVVYVKSNSNTPLTTQITYSFPNGQNVCYDCENIILANYDKEQLIDNQLYAYIPFYLTRYEKNIVKGDIDNAINDLIFFKDALTASYKDDLLSSEELLDIMNYINRIISHITDGSIYEERMVSIMGGHVEETPSEALKRIENEKIALNLFQNGITYELVRKSIPTERVSDEKLQELYALSKTTA